MMAAIAQQNNFNPWPKQHSQQRPFAVNFGSPTGDRGRTRCGQRASGAFTPPCKTASRGSHQPPYPSRATIEGPAKSAGCRSRLRARGSARPPRRRAA